MTFAAYASWPAEAANVLTGRCRASTRRPAQPGQAATPRQFVAPGPGPEPAAEPDKATQLLAEEA